jgi:predicted MFS family arabinose efflux permease
MLKNYFTQLKAIPKPIWVLFIATTINRLGMMALPFLALYLTQQMHFTTVHAGWVLSVYGFGSLFASLMSGVLSDKYNPVRIMITSLMLTGIVLFMFPFFDSIWVIYACTLLFSLSNEIFRPALFTAISQLSQTGDSKTYFAFIRLGINLGMSVGPALGGFLATISYHLIFVVDAVTSLLAGTFLYLSYKRNNLITAPKAVETGAVVAKEPFLLGLKKAISDKKLLIVCLGLLPASIVFHQHESTLPVNLVQDFHYSESFYGLIFVVNTVMIVILELPMYLKFKNVPEKVFMVVGTLGIALGFGLLSLSGAKAVILFSVVLWTIGEMCFFPTVSAVVTKISPEKLKGSYMGVLTFCFNLSLIFGPLLGTWLYQYYGARVLWLTCGGLGFFSTMVYLFRKAD